MKTKAAVVYEPGKRIEIDELDLDRPQDGEVLIRYLYAGLSCPRAGSLTGPVRLICIIGHPFSPATGPHALVPSRVSGVKRYSTTQERGAGDSLASGAGVRPWCVTPVSRFPKSRLIRVLRLTGGIPVSQINRRTVINRRNVAAGAGDPAARSPTRDREAEGNPSPPASAPKSSFGTHRPARTAPPGSRLVS